MKFIQFFCWVAVLAIAGGAALGDEVLRISDTGASVGAARVNAEPAAIMRGYGKIEATSRVFAARHASILLLRCEDAGKAKLTLAKYESDLQVLPGVAAARIGDQPGFEIAGQGAVVAFRAGASVCVLAAGDDASIEALAKECVAGDRAGFSYQPEVKVPMWLDRWDRYGFRFYYSNPGKLPPDQTARTYDISKEFPYAEKMDHAGLLFWQGDAPMDGAECQMHLYPYDWALKEAEERHLPVGIQLSFPGTTWIANRLREETAQKMPDFCGDRYRPASDFDGGQGAISWSSVPGNAIGNARMAASVKYLEKYDCITSWLEPHSEMKHGAQDVLMEYGEVADKTFREYLKSKYGPDVKAVSERWAAAAGSLRTWDDIHVPELASFLGWGGDAIDLKGEWKAKFYYDQDQFGPNPIPAPETWALPAVADSDWPTVTAPGHDRTMFLPKHPAVYRRTFSVPAEWIHPGEKAWLYVWDLDPAGKQNEAAYLNGQELGHGVVIQTSCHWAAYEASSVLKAGDNQLSLYLPAGYLAYKVYLSRHSPVQYPNLGTGENARWADFSNWNEWSRARAVRNTAIAVRQADPDRGMSFAHPDEYVDELRQVCEEVGGEFHNTGYMSGFWAEFLPMLMRGAGLPMSVEPGNGAATLEQFKNYLGLWETEGIQGVDYFMHIGETLWNPAIKEHFEEHQNELRLIGKYHVPQAELGVLMTSRIAGLVGWPWGQDLNNCLGGGYWSFNPSECLRKDFEHDGLIPEDFASGRANRYRVIVDTNTSVMDDATVSRIEDYVRQGGVFVTYVQTGRHTPERKDAWPIERLSGYHVTRIDQLDAKGLAPFRAVKLEPGQTMFAGDYTFPAGNGLTLEKRAPDCVDLMRWADDGSVAAGMRPVGKGWIITAGVKFANDRIGWGDTTATRHFFSAILDHFGLARIPATITGPVSELPLSNKPGMMVSHSLPLTMRHYESNNGLYDLWVIWNSTKAPATATLEFAKGFVPASCVEARAWKPVALETVGGNTVAPDLKFDPLEVRTFLTPRSAVAQAPMNWLHLQEGWWPGGGAAVVAAAPEPPEVTPKFSMPLDEDWSYRTLSDTEDAAPYVAADAPASGWETRRLGIVSCSLNGPRHGVFRRTFVVPETWTSGRREFWLTSWMGSTFAETGHVYLDGQLLQTWGANDNLTKSLAPGSRHTVAVEVKSAGTLMGVLANCWLQWLPESALRQDLAGDWTGSNDYLRYDQALKFPDSVFSNASARRDVTVDPSEKGRTVVLRVEGDIAAPLGVLINGRWLRRHHHCIGTRLELNITPWVRFGQSNEIELVAHGKCKLTEVALHFYEKGAYP